MTAPIYRIGDVVYLVESASLGELEAYKIGAISSREQGGWVYQIFIDMRPTVAGQTVEDRFDLRNPTELYFDESEITDLCDAVDLALTNIQGRMNRNMSLIAECPTTGLPVIPAGAPKFEIDDTVIIKASADIGFIEAYKVVQIYRAPNEAQYVYRLNTHGKVQPATDFKIRSDKFNELFFREQELMTLCDALNTTLLALDRKIARLLALKAAHCPDGSTGSL